jgi:lipopolysaccharide export system permease protein
MNLFNRYVFRSLAFAMIFVTITVSGAVWLTQSIRFLQMAVGGGAPFRVFLELVALSLPNFISIVMPISMLAIVLFVYNRMNAESEIVVMRAAGLPPWQLARPALILGVVMALVMFVMNAYIGPVSNRTMKMVRNDAQNEYSNILLRDGVFNNLGALTIYVRDRDYNGDLLGIMIEDDKDPKNPRTIVAKRGVLVDTETGPRLIVYNGERQELDHATQHISRLTFDDYTIDLKFLGAAENDHWIEPSDRTLFQLLRSSKDPRDKGFESYFLAEANGRIASPLFMLAFTLIGVTCLLVGEFDRRGQAKRILRAVIISVMIQIIYVGLSNLSRKFTLLIPLMYLAGIAPIGVCWWIIRYRTIVLRPRLGWPWQKVEAA